VRLALEPLVAVADRCRAAVVGLIHVNKGEGADPLTLIMGSRAFVAVARAVLFVMSDPDDEKVRLVGQPKNNLGRTDLPTLKFTIEGVKVTDTDEGEVWTGRLVWSGETDRSIASYLEDGAAGGEQRTAVGEAAVWLNDYLLTQGGRAKSRDCKVEGGKAGHTRDALQRACKKLKVQTEAEGFPRTTWWSLPQSADASGESSPTQTTQSTQTDVGRRATPVDAVVGVVGVVGLSRGDAATGPACEACRRADGSVSFSGVAHQMLCRDCWRHPESATQSEMF
jgi:hypothetical protein